MSSQDGNNPPTSPRRPRGNTTREQSAHDPELDLPRRAATSAAEDTVDENLRRRSRNSRLSRVPSLNPRTTLSQRTAGQFTLAGPDDTPQLRTAHEPFVQPGYADLNPSYDQANNAKPVWSLAKPLPRVVRPGMVPTKNELLENRMNAQLPVENSQKEGLDVDPNEIEKGRIEKSKSLRKIAAQVTDARIQRENNFINTILGQGNDGTTVGRRSSRMSRVSSQRMSRLSSQRQRRSTAAGRPPMSPPAHLDPVKEGEAESGSSSSNDSDPAKGTEPFPPVDDDAVLDDDEPTEGDQNVDSLGIDEAAFPDELHPLVQDLVESEIHNNHTAWSVIRTHHREGLAESIGVYVQLLIGFSSDLSVTVSKAGDPNTTEWAWGFATMMGIYISGGVSGAHLNPAITIMLWFYRGFPKRKMPEYFLAQFMGAFCACLTAYGIYYRSIHHYLLKGPVSDIVDSFVTSQREPWINPGTALFNEFLGTMCLTIAVLALGDDQNAPPGAGMNAVVIGFIIVALCFAFAYQTGAALNPSRDFGPRLCLLFLGYGSELFTNPFWFYGPWAGSIMGAFTGAFIYDFFIFTGGESPVNYPLERTKRAMHKSRMKWSRRLHLLKDDAEDKMA